MNKETDQLHNRDSDAPNLTEARSSRIQMMTMKGQTLQVRQAIVFKTVNLGLFVITFLNSVSSYLVLGFPGKVCNICQVVQWIRAN